MAISIGDIVTQEPSAQINTGAGSGSGIDYTKVVSPDNFYYNIIVYFLWFVSFVAVIALIYGGVQYITAGGEAEKAERGKKTIIGAIIGLLIIIGAYTIYNSTIKTLDPNTTPQAAVGSR